MIWDWAWSAAQISMTVCPISNHESALGLRIRLIFEFSQNENLKKSLYLVLKEALTSKIMSKDVDVKLDYLSECAWCFDLRVRPKENFCAKQRRRHVRAILCDFSRCLEHNFTKQIRLTEVPIWFLSHCRWKISTCSHRFSDQMVLDVFVHHGDPWQNLGKPVPRSWAAQPCHHPITCWTRPAYRISGIRRLPAFGLAGCRGQNRFSFNEKRPTWR